MSEERFRGRPDRVFVFDASWRILVHGVPGVVGSSLEARGFLEDVDEPEGMLQARAAYSADYEVDGEAMLGEIVGLPELRWGVLVEHGHEWAYEAVRLTWLWALLIGAAFVVIATLLGLLLGRRIAGPVVTLSRAARRVADGDLDVHVQVPSTDEVGELAEAFNRMVVGLREREFIRDTFGRYVTEEVAAQVLSDPESLKLGGDARPVTILMSDLRGFTSLSERLGPQGMVSLLNRYFDRMADVVARHNGHLSEFVGDGLVVFFGAPTLGDDDALRAMACAIDMQLSLRGFCEGEGRPLEMGIGINTGEVIAGNIGSPKRMKYGVVGDAINLAARLESFTVGTQVMISEASLAEVGDAVEVGPVQEQRAKGKREPVRYHELLAVRAPRELRMPEAEATAEVPWARTVRCYAVDGKQVAEEAQPARSTHLSDNGLRLEADWEPQRLANLKLTIELEGEAPLEDVYAKVMATEAVADSSPPTWRFELRFTSLPDRERSVVDAAVATAGEL